MRHMPKSLEPKDMIVYMHETWSHMNAGGLLIFERTFPGSLFYGSHLHLGLSISPVWR